MEEPKERHKKQVYIQGPTHLHAQESHRSTRLKVIIFTQRPCIFKRIENIPK